MKCFLALLFLVGAALGQKLCEFPGQITAGYLAAGKGDSGSPALVLGNLALDKPGNRIYMSYQLQPTDGKQGGQIWLLYNEGKMYFKQSGGKCYENDIPHGSDEGFQYYKFPPNAKFLTSGRIADSDFGVNVYTASENIEGSEVKIVLAVTKDSCVPAITDYVTENGAVYYQMTLANVVLSIDERSFELPKDCEHLPGRSKAGLNLPRLRFLNFK